MKLILLPPLLYNKLSPSKVRQCTQGHIVKTSHSPLAFNSYTFSSNEYHLHPAEKWLKTDSFCHFLSSFSPCLSSLKSVSSSQKWGYNSISHLPRNAMEMNMQAKKVCVILSKLGIPVQFYRLIREMNNPTEKISKGYNKSSSIG
jgi:hypothetical protein